jgi:hypothetical protein
VREEAWRRAERLGGGRSRPWAAGRRGATALQLLAEKLWLLVSGCRVKPFASSASARLMSAGMLEVEVSVSKHGKQAPEQLAPRACCEPGELDSVGVGEMRAPAARPASSL